MTYICICGHDYSEHFDMQYEGRHLMPCDDEECSCLDYREAL